MVIATNILLLFAASIGKNSYKQVIPKNVASIQIQKVAIFNSDRKKNSI